jgi:hypothetical protein
MTKKRFVWNLLGILCVVVLLVSGTWVKAADAASLTHHELILKDEKGKPLGKAYCQFRGEDGKLLGSAISTVDGLITALAHPGATLVCVSKEQAVHTGEVKVGSKHITTKKQALAACWTCYLIVDNPSFFESCMAHCSK